MPLLDDFETALRSRLGLKIRQRIAEDNATILFVDLTSLRLNFHPQTPFLLIPEHTVEVHRISLRGVLRDLRVRHRLTERTCFIVVDGEVDRQAAGVESPLAQVALVGRQQAREILKAPSISDGLVAVARSQLPRTTLSPYETSRPVTGSQFFGRETEIRLIVSKPERSYAVLGMRRVGKTSLMKEIMRLVTDQEIYERRFGSSTEGSRTTAESVIFVDCSTHSGNDLLRTIIERIDIRKVRRFNFARYEDLLWELSSRGKRPIHIFLDETDTVLEADKRESWGLLKKLRASAIEGYARYVLAGHQRLTEQLIKKETPIFNFVQPIEIGSLRRDAALQLLQEPMSLLGVKVERPIADRIIRESGGHPNIIQFYCQFFIEQLDREGRDVILSEDLEALQNDANFNNFVMSTFEINTSPLEKLLIFLMLEPEKFTLKDADRMLAKNKILIRDRSLQVALNNLRYGGFLKQVGQAYTFNIPILGQLLAQRYDLDYLVRHMRMEEREALLRF